jgi:hypothetical protein
MQDTVIGHPTVAGGAVPPGFRPSFSEASLRDAEFIRLPPPSARCPLTGLSRTTLIELGDRGLISVKRVRKPGAMRGIVLIEKDSLLRYLRGLPQCVAQNELVAH